MFADLAGFPAHKHYGIGYWLLLLLLLLLFFFAFFCLFSFLVALLNGTTYQNNSIVTLEDIGEGGDALLYMTNYTACCQRGVMGPALGNWFFPNGSRVKMIVH